MAIVRVGVSNGQMPGKKSSFPEEYRNKSRLHYYSRLFNTIEVNSSFYKTPLYQTCVKWAADVPEDFRFTLKLSRDITHVPHVNYDYAILEHYMQAVSGIGSKKGCLLIQFPGKVTLEYFGQLEKLLAQITDRDPEQQWPLAVEFRNDSWYAGETSELLNEYKAAMVLHDYSKARVSTLSDKASFTYLRFHGPSGNYRDSYEEATLKQQVERIQQWVNDGRDVYVYFNNTAGNAFENAVYLQAQLGL